jgi:putative N-acetyltransferase (TIGR04045 family)
VTTPEADPVTCVAATTSDELAAHHRIRREVFVGEQALFQESDADEHDRGPEVIRVLGLCGSVPAGTVRLYPLDPGTGVWQGDRLAVLAPYRTRGLGKPLVRFAVATASALGGRLMVAHIQLDNVAFFQRLGWTADGATELYVGVPHQQMTIELHRRRRVPEMRLQGSAAPPG